MNASSSRESVALAVASPHNSDPSEGVRCNKCGENQKPSIDAIDNHVCGKKTVSISRRTNVRPEGPAREVHAILPEVYHNLRSLFGITTRQFLDSVGLNSIARTIMRGHFSRFSGRCTPHEEQHNHYVCCDDRFFFQILTQEQSSKLVQFVEPYYNHIQSQGPGTHMFRLVGHFRVLALPENAPSTCIDPGDFSFVVFHNPLNLALTSTQPNTLAHPKMVRRYEVSGSVTAPVARRYRADDRNVRVAPIGDILDFVHEQVC